MSNKQSFIYSDIFTIKAVRLIRPSLFSHMEFKANKKGLTEASGYTATYLLDPVYNKDSVDLYYSEIEKYKEKLIKDCGLKKHNFDKISFYINDIERNEEFAYAKGMYSIKTKCQFTKPQVCKVLYDENGNVMCDENGKVRNIVLTENDPSVIYNGVYVDARIQFRLYEGVNGLGCTVATTMLRSLVKGDEISVSSGVIDNVNLDEAFGDVVIPSLNSNVDAQIPF